MVLFNLAPTFLYPTAREYPLDEVAENIVRELEKRNWDVPGIEVGFDIYGSGEKKYMKVVRVAGKDFVLEYDREQGDLDSINKDKAGLWIASISGEEIWMYLYPSGGPDYCRWVGKKDIGYSPDEKKEFFVRRKGQGITPNSRLSRTPKKVSYSETFDRFVKWLKENVLDYIQSFPEAEEIKPAFQPEELIPYNGLWDTVYYTDCTINRAEFILECQKDLERFPLENRFTHIRREMMVNPLLYLIYNDMPSEYFGKYTVCKVSREKAFADTYDWYYVVGIKPRYANGIYVVDRGAFVYNSEEDRGEAELEMMKTLIPINEYKGGYEKPSVLIGREIDFDEIVLVEQKRKSKA